MIEAHISDLILKKRGGTVKTFVLTPEDTVESRGILLGIFLFSSSSSKTNDTIKTIIGVVASKFYDDQAVVTDPHQHFESVLQESNAVIAEYIQKEKIYFNPLGIHGFIVLQTGEEISFTQIGNMRALILLRTKEGKLFSSPIHEDLEPPTPTKLFSSVSNGQIKAGQKMFISSPKVFETLTEKTIASISAKFPSERALEQFKHLLGSFPYAGAMMFVDFVDQKDGKTLQSESSLLKLRSTQDATKQILTSSFQNYLGSIGNIISKQISQGKENLKKAIKEKSKISTPTLLKLSSKISPSVPDAPIEPELEENTLEEKVKNNPEIKPLVGTSVKAVNSFLQNALVQIKAKTKFLEKWREIKPRKLKHPKIVHPKIPKSIHLTSSMNRGIDWFNRLPSKSKKIFILGLIAAYLFVQSLVIISKRNDASKNTQSFNQVVTIIEEQLSAAEASLIFRDEARTRIMLNDVEELISNNPQKKDERQAILDQFDQTRVDLLEKIRHAEKIDNPEVVKDFAGFSENINLSNLIELDNNIYTYDKAANSIYKLNLSNKQVLTLDGADTLQSPINLSTPQGDNAIIYADQDNRLSRVQLDTFSVRVADIIFGNANPSIKDFRIFNDRLYILDHTNNQIYRHQQTNSGYGKGLPWVTNSNVNLRDGISMAIDGAIYVLKQNNTIIRLAAGVQKPLALGAIEPRLNTATKIWTNDESDFIYLLDPAGKRIIVLDKKVSNTVTRATIKVQYESDQFSDIKDFVIKEKDKAIYLLDGNKLLKLNTTPLK